VPPGLGRGDRGIHVERLGHGKVRRAPRELHVHRLARGDREFAEVAVAAGLQLRAAHEEGVGPGDAQ
jgi:hypothetical protein